METKKSEPKINKQDLASFLSSWKKTNELYQQICPNNSIGFPEPLQKKIVIAFFDPDLSEGKGSYDFTDKKNKNIEMKSSTRENGGCTPFKFSQSECDRIIYFEVDDIITIYELNKNKVKEVNKKVTEARDEEEKRRKDSKEKGEEVKEVTQVSIKLKDFIGKPKTKMMLLWV